ncbi:protein Niban 2b [Gymnodraco acuticeps]|uniref:Protein Niban 2b n=1 Tax=Gymnodraco acuticeps TaxID=8218 RepID=A0A6P8TZY1_GYMAC|nr:protein Niban 2b [Gymnodraco acuticeps]
MGDVISSHLDEGRRELISAQTREVMGEFGRLYEQQYAVALFNKVRFDIEGGAGPQPQLLHRKIPLENKSIFSGSLFHYLEENKKWRNHFVFVPDSYNLNYYDSKAAHDRHLHPKGTINCAGYKVLTSMEQYLDLFSSSSLPGMEAKVGSSPFLKFATQFPLILWHPYARSQSFCVVTEAEQRKWQAVLQDCVRHTNDGLKEDNKVQTPAFTDAVRLYRQAQGHYGTWEMMCGVPSQILANLVMEGLLPELRELISPRLKGKLHERQRNWMLISDAVYSLVQGQCQAQYQAVVQKCEAACSSLEASIRCDMDQIISSKEHVSNKIREVVLPKAEKLLKVSIQPYISSILDALMEPTSRGFSEVRDVFFRELVDMSKNSLNNGTKEAVAQHMEKISMLAFHPVKMQSCYEKVEPLSLEGLQQRFDVSSPSVFVQRAQILMREQMDHAVYTFEQILHQSLESQGTEELCKAIQRCQDRVIKKFDYDSSTVRKRFFREALLQIFIPYMLKQLSPACGSELPRFRELIFEDFSRFILVENIFEEVVLHSVMKNIMMAVKEVAVQRRHNLYRDSIVLGNSDPSLHLLGENPSIDWAEEYGGAQEEAEPAGQAIEEEEGGESQRRRRMKQVVSMIQVEGSPVLPNESCMEVPSVDDIPKEKDRVFEENSDEHDQDRSASPSASENVKSVDEEKAKPEEQGREEVPLKLQSAGEENSRPMGEPQLPCNQEEAPGQASKEASTEASKEAQEEAPGEASPEEASGEASPEEASGEASPEEASGEASEEASGEMPEEASKEASEDASGEASEEASKEASEEALPPPPPPEESLPGAMDTDPEGPPEPADLPQPPHHDSGFQSPTSEEAEGQE